MRKYFRKIINPWKINDITESICKTNKKKEIRIAIGCHRITTALHSSHATHIIYIRRKVIWIFSFSHFLSNQIAGNFFKWCYHEGIAQHKNFMSMRYLFHPTRRRSFSYKFFINTKRKKKVSPERNIRIMHNSCQLLPWEKSYMKDDRKWLQFLSVSGPVGGSRQWGEAIQAIWGSKSLVKPIIKIAASFSRPESSRKNPSRNSQQKGIPPTKSYKAKVGMFA